jgi:FAD-dependent urate hydroxylase
VVIGDAAHAPIPSSGQGASLAIEDAVVLAMCLRDLPHQEAFGAYERLRRARVERIAKVAARVNSSEAAGLAVWVFRDAILPVILRLTTNSKQVTEQYRYHIDWDTLVSPVTT